MGLGGRGLEKARRHPAGGGVEKARAKRGLAPHGSARAEFFFAKPYSRQAMPILIELICRYSHFTRMARPQFRSTAELREWAMLYSFAGMSRRDIAIALRVDVKTLAKHFGRDLRDGPTVIRERLVAALEKAAAEGTKSARHLLATMTTGQTPRGG